MDILVIDGEHVSDMKQLHEHIAAQLHFPRHYGKNLDALYDCLTDMSKVAVHVHNYGALKEHVGDAAAEGLMDVFLDLCAVKPECSLVVSSASPTESGTFNEIFEETCGEEDAAAERLREKDW
ncbi:MAG: barstar family protein [Lachnospiraceae bacterium]|nr:barstar family protein [Lachnospiraceae bacterium]